MKKKIKVERVKAEHGTSLLTAFREIRELIVHGRLAPGTWILEADLAERLNMSRTPVRGAIHWLQREGYVLERLARKLIAADPKLKQEFDHKLTSDPQFAESRSARLNWFYQRSPWWDSRLGLYPVGRLSSISGLPLE